MQSEQIMLLVTGVTSRKFVPVDPIRNKSVQKLISSILSVRILQFCSLLPMSSI